MLYVTGDCHGEYERFGSRKFSAGPGDGVLVCGDFGVRPPEDRSQRYWSRWLAEKPFEVLFCAGNHEYFPCLNSLPGEDWMGGKIHRLAPNVIHLMDGEVFAYQGKTIFVMGGAQSHDVEDGLLDPNAPDYRARKRDLDRRHGRYRTIGVDWWPEELPDPALYDRARANLDRVGWKVDLVITHCAPTGVQRQMPDLTHPGNHLTDFLQQVWERLDFGAWYCGHYHRETVLSGVTILYESICPIP